jgi:hypothetical protein
VLSPGWLWVFCPTSPPGGGGNIGVNAHANSWPSASFDPADPRDVIVAFVGRVAVIPTTDAMICVSHDAGRTFHPDTGRFRFTAADLSLPNDPDVPMHVFHISAAIDGLGGVNLMYCLTQASAEEQPVSINYARWTSVSALSGPPAFKHRLAGPFTGTPVGFEANDYHMLTATKCWVYAVYVHPDAQGRINAYVRRVFIGSPRPNYACPTPVDAADMATFTDAYLAGSARADFNDDGFVDAADFAAYLNEYNAAQP